MPGSARRGPNGTYYSGGPESAQKTSLEPHPVHGVAEFLDRLGRFRKRRGLLGGELEFHHLFDAVLSPPPLSSCAGERTAHGRIIFLPRTMDSHICATAADGA